MKNVKGDRFSLLRARENTIKELQAQRDELLDLLYYTHYADLHDDIKKEQKIHEILDQYIEDNNIEI